MLTSTNKHLVVALLIGILFHGTSIFFTLEFTYDALIHIYFADHYANSWFEPWNYGWYTGFSVLGYPPLVHQSIALFSFIGGLKFGLFSVAIIATLLFITGIYRFSYLMTSNKRVSGYAAILGVLSSAFLETMHIFGQLPSIVGIAILMHTLPEIYGWVTTGNKKFLFTSFSLLAVTITSHHVTSIFGLVFFIFPLIGMAITDIGQGEVGEGRRIGFLRFFRIFFRLFKRIIGLVGGILFITLFCILPYWINVRDNPITQIPIPHGSRDNFLEVTSSGLVFFVIPWGVLLFVLPYIFYRYYSKRYFFFGLSLTLLFILGTGGTTPIPLTILGENAFNILTLDRFTLWGAIMSLPIFGELVYRFVESDLKRAIVDRFGQAFYKIIGGAFAVAFVFMMIFTMSLGYFRPMQPQKIKMLPILNFLSQDQHDHWRYLPLGFGDQMAWLSAQTNAMTVDGNYHSSRRLPELTSRAIERLENSKFKGVEGIGSLQQFLTVPEKYHLKYVFSNDKFYDPLLYFCGWQRLRRLENGIMVWEKLNVPPLSSILPKEDVPLYQKLMWGLIPVLSGLIAFIINIVLKWIETLKSTSEKEDEKPMEKVVEDIYRLLFVTEFGHFKKWLLRITLTWSLMILLLVGVGVYIFYIKNASQISPENVMKAYYDALDFKEFEKAYTYLDPLEQKTLDQYMLEVSITDGLLSSYAKLDEINVAITEQTDSTAKAMVATHWVTPLDRIYKEFHHELRYHKRKWVIRPNEYSRDIPADQLLSENGTQFFNHGRRKVSSEQTYHEDVLRQPVLEVFSASLVRYRDEFSIIGELQNIDNTPADVVVKGTLYSAKDKELASHNAKHLIKHKLLPKETTSFKVNFEGIAWLSALDSVPKTFDPHQFTPIQLKERPEKFNLQCAGNISTTDLYKGLTINDLKIKEGKVSGVLFNAGLRETTIPQLLISYYTKDKELIWIDHQYQEESIRIQRKQYFTYSLMNLEEVTILTSDIANVFINGRRNSEVQINYVPGRKKKHQEKQLIPVEGRGFSYIKIELNNYLGNPF
ncbi:hypothetical protein ACFSTE_08515 [Aquimarina hainanensis]|uniref:Membrane protein 6-pyruvoyl-tetrahydropterin synthase-related domain-containing protein n=1 Tax=Aquimarina hainanensis TaxID=1578017 RepID=A0ABW5N7D1_9FLAO